MEDNRKYPEDIEALMKTGQAIEGDYRELKAIEVDETFNGNWIETPVTPKIVNTPIGIVTVFEASS